MSDNKAGGSWSTPPVFGMCWFNREFIPTEEARIPITSHGIHYGASPFEGIRFYETSKGRAIFRLDDHVKRLLFSAGAVGMDLPYDEDAISRAIRRLVALSSFSEGYIRPIIVFGEKLGIAPPKETP